jgi:di/tricarboxylate transporter
MFEQTIVFATLMTALVLFIWGRWRYDIVAVIALLIVSFTGIVPPGEVFSGFGHPAVITVGAVLILSRALMNSGLVDLIARWVFKLGKHPMIQIGVMTSLVALFSGFMNNVGALAILLPVAVQIARKSGTPPSVLLMPLAFGSLLGGLMTMIGTPPNIIIAMARTTYAEQPFRMFDFAPVGAGVALAGVLFITLIGWRLLPKRTGQKSAEDLFHIEDYITEVRIDEGNYLIGKRLRDQKLPKGIDINIIGIVRGKKRLVARAMHEVLQPKDILIVEADSENLQIFVEWGRFELEGKKIIERGELESDEIGLIEVVVMTDSYAVNKNALSLNLRRKYGINLIAVSRKGERVKARLGEIRFRPGDVLLLNGPKDTLQESMQTLSWLPLAERNLKLGQEKRIIASLTIFSGAIFVAAVGLIPIQIAFVAAAVIMVAVGLLSIKEIYESVDWSIIVLLGAMIPVGQALETSGGAELIAGLLLQISGGMPPVISLLLLMVGTMFLSDIINNAAAAVLMAPIAINLAIGIGASADPFLISVALGASCAFLTPIGHQSNTLVMGPGGYQFGDYWRLGLPLEIIIVIVGIPLIFHFWPLGI